MCGEQKFYKCSICGNLIGMIFSSGAVPVCCGKEMTELVANTVEASREKHLPVVAISGNEVTVTVGSILHPSLPEHHIEWVYIQTNMGGQRKCIQIGSQPVAKFMLTEGEKLIAAFEYCNLHGLWKTVVNT